MRIVSLLPSATENVAALGLTDQLVAVSHECDFPTTVQGLPRATASILPPGLDQAEIDRRDNECAKQGIIAEVREEARNACKTVASKLLGLGSGIGLPMCEVNRLVKIMFACQASSPFQRKLGAGSLVVPRYAGRGWAPLPGSRFRYQTSDWQGRVRL